LGAETAKKCKKNQLLKNKKELFLMLRFKANFKFIVEARKYPQNNRRGRSNILIFGKNRVNGTFNPCIIFRNSEFNIFNVPRRIFVVQISLH
jgi:hypothetical protein